MNLPQNMILIYKFLGRMVHFFTARFACMRIHFQSNFIRTFTNGQKKNGGSFTEEIAGDIQRDPFDLFAGNGELPEKPTDEENEAVLPPEKSTGDGNEAGQSPQNENTGNGVGSDQTPPSGIAQESMVSVRI